MACSAVQFSEAGPNQHTIMFRDDAWPHSDEYNTLALTTVTFDTDTGEILDADMEINTKQHSIVTTTPVPSGSYDLESIITHEAGHFLGLAHTPDDSAVMYALYKPGSATLTPDDVAGICAVYAPGGARSTEQDAGRDHRSPSRFRKWRATPRPKAGFGTSCGVDGPLTPPTGRVHDCIRSGSRANGRGTTGSQRDRAHRRWGWGSRSRAGAVLGFRA